MPPTRVTILGSGPAGLATAFELTDPALEGAYEVTVYQVGWRSGGLCAGGRVAPEYWVNQNGTHFLFGCYAESLHILRTCCEELIANGDTRWGPFEQHIIPRPLIVMKQLWKGEWTNWEITFPTREGDVGAHRPPMGMVDVFRMAVRSLVAFITGDEFQQHVMQAGAELGTLGRVGLRAQVEAVQLSARALGAQTELFLPEGTGLISETVRHALALLLKAVRAAVHALLRPFLDDSLTLTRAWILLDFALTALAGVLEDDAVGPQLVDALDTRDLREWLLLKGGSQTMVDSPAIALWYASMAAFRDGDPDRPYVAAGASLSCLMQIAFGYIGDVSYQMRWEVGDTMIGPIVAALKARGVKFMYFHRVWDLVPQGDHIDSVVIERQVELKVGNPADYDPFIYPPSAGGRPLCPDVPSLDQVQTVYAAGHENTLDRFWCPRAGPEFTLRRGVDYDVLVSAVSSPTMRWYASRLRDASTTWADALTNVRSVETQGLRLWFKGTLQDIGWDGPAPVLSSYVLPYATWEDPTPVLATENWPAPPPQTVAHVFGPLGFGAPYPEPGETAAGYAYLAAQQARAQADAKTWLTQSTSGIWPGACLPNSTALDPSACVKPAIIPPADGPGQARANSGPDQAYLWLYPGTWRYRFWPEDTGFRGFYVAGDWTRTSFPCGSVEGACLSGRRAGYKIVNG